MSLRRFQTASLPLTAQAIKQITGINHTFMSTLFGLDIDSGKAILKNIKPPQPLQTITSP